MSFSTGKQEALEGTHTAITESLFLVGLVLYASQPMDYTLNGNF